MLVIADDCRHYDLGCYGSPDAITPNIDRLAAQGLRFERFFQATAMSSPTRHCLLTGLYPVRSGAYPNHTRLDEGVQTLPEYLKEAGYRVALQGKRHIAPIKAFPFEFLSEESLRSVHPEKIEPFLADVARRATVSSFTSVRPSLTTVDARRPQPLESRRPHAALQPRQHARNAPPVPQLPRGDQRAGQPGGRGGLPAPQIRA